MSFILDALRRAESERERGRVPTLHAQPAQADAVLDDRPAAGPGRRWLWALLALLVLGLAFASRGLWRQEPAPSAAPPPAAVTIAPPPVTPAAIVLPTPPAPPTPQPVAAAPAPRLAAKPPAKPAEASAVADRPLPSLAELPEPLRRQLPPLTAGGAMYSDTPANRMLILNGQVLHEGDQVAPGLLLEQIKLKGAVLAFKGQRFSISF